MVITANSVTAVASELKALKPFQFELARFQVARVERSETQATLDAGYHLKEPLINLIKRADARRRRAKNRSLHGVNEYFEPGCNAADAASVN
jgi:hypothetical protein